MKDESINKIYFNFGKLNNLPYNGTDGNLLTNEKLVSKLLHGDIVVHSGIFHADDVFAVALVILIRNLYGSKDNKIIRIPKTEDLESFKDPLVMDLLGGQYDHHMTENQKKYRDKNSVLSDLLDTKYSYFASKHEKFPFASFGALWNNVGCLFQPNVRASNIKLDITKKFDSNFIFTIDMQDNFGPADISSPLSRVISNFNTLDGDQDEKFRKAVDFAIPILESEIKVEQSEIEALSLVSELELKGISNNKYLVIPESNDYNRVNQSVVNDYINESGETPDFIINLNPSPRDGSIRMLTVHGFVLSSESILNSRKSPDCVFTHNAGFLSTWKSLDSLMNFINSDEFKLIKK